MHRSTLIFILALLGCGGTPEQPPPACPDGDAGQGVSLGDVCVHVSARVKSGGSWVTLASGEVSVRPAGAAAAALSVEAGAPAEAFELVIEGLSGSAILQQGYQSWSFSGAVQIPGEVPRDPDGSLAARAAFTGDPLDEVAGVSYGAALVGDPGGGAAVAIGAASSAVATTAVAAEGAGHPKVTVLHGAAREPLPVSSGKVEMAEIIVALADRPVDALATLAAEIGRALPDGARTPVRPSGGWYSWNQLFDEVTEGDILAHVDIVASDLAPKGLPLVEIDDGWEVAWGDWRANAKFPSGMSGVGQAILAKQLEAGVWLAPFLVDVDSLVAKNTDPSLFVRGPGDQPLDHKPSGSNKHYYVLDGTNPASMKIAADPMAALAAQGYRHFKLDFLYAGALPGQRHDPAATGTEALLRGLATLRVAMGEEAVFNACGAPIFPLLGHADSMRIGSDTAFSGVSLAWADVVYAARSTAARSFLSPLVWLDGDQTQVRSPYTEDEARASAFVAALAGPAYSLGDDLRVLPPDRLALALAPEALDLAGADAPAVPADPLESPAEDVVGSPLLDTITHLGSTGAPPPATFTMKGKSGATYTLAFSWFDAHGVTVTK